MPVNPFRARVQRPKDMEEMTKCDDTHGFRQCAAARMGSCRAPGCTYCCSSDALNVPTNVQAARAAPNGRCCTRRFYLLVIFSPLGSHMGLIQRMRGVLPRRNCRQTRVRRSMVERNICEATKYLRGNTLGRPGDAGDCVGVATDDAFP